MHLADLTPAVLRLQDGWRIRGKLQVISVTGGLLCLSEPLSQGCQVKVLFLTHAGPVLGDAEMLNRVPSGLQPFRFTTLCEDDRSRLQALIEPSMDQNHSDQDQLQKKRGDTYEGVWFCFKCTCGVVGWFVVPNHVNFGGLLSPILTGCCPKLHRTTIRGIDAERAWMAPEQKTPAWYPAKSN
jgi:hypothetical protein